MLVRIVSKYLETHKRLVIPQLGVFIVKEPGCVLFSELLKREDGVLRGLLKEEGISELEAAGEIDRFVFEIRHAVERGVGSPLHGFGLMKPGSNGTILFEYNPQQQDPALRERKPLRRAARLAAEPAVAEPPVDESPASDPIAVEPPVTELSAGEPAVDEPPITGDAAAATLSRPPHALLEHNVQAVKKALSESTLSCSVKLNPEPYVKGLRYGKPHKNTNAYTYVGHSTRRWGVDRFLLVAITAAAIAVAVIAFGYFRKSREEARELRQAQQEQTETGVNQPEQPNS